MALRAICLPAIHFPSCFISSHSSSRLGVPFISAIALSTTFFFGVHITKLNLKFLLSLWKPLYGQAPSYIRVTAAQTFLAAALAAFDLKIQVTSLYSFQLLLLTDLKLIANTLQTLPILIFFYWLYNTFSCSKCGFLWQLPQEGANLKPWNITDATNTWRVLNCLSNNNVFCGIARLFFWKMSLPPMWRQEWNKN